MAFPYLAAALGLYTVARMFDTYLEHTRAMSRVKVLSAEEVKKRLVALEERVDDIDAVATAAAKKVDDNRARIDRHRKMDDLAQKDLDKMDKLLGERIDTVNKQIDLDNVVELEQTAGD
jgi:peptidoglycan hydrolase CwlO-like protein